jgi:AmmeMemoRadiSam system protein B
MNKLPKVRFDIQITTAVIQGQQAMAVRDLIGLQKDVVMLKPEMLSLLPLFDGEHTIRDLQLLLMRQQGNQLVMMHEAEQVVQNLDRLLILQTDRYEKKKQELKESFSSLDQRPMSHAGSAYPKEPNELKALLNEIIAGVKNNSDRVPEPIRVLVAPHIDLSAGRSAYGKAYTPIKGTKPDRLVILGTGHNLDEGLFSLTTKDYLTPLGRFPTDIDAVGILQKAGAGIVASDDFAHRNEHSIEFQMVFLRFLMDQDTPVVPVLVGSFVEYVNKVDRPAEIPQVASFLKAVSEMINEKTLLVAGVDLSHVGPKFGHPHPASHYEDNFRAHDQALLDAVCAGSVTDFWAEGKRVQDQYHVCGFGALACLLEILPGLNGRVLDYQVWHEDQTRSAVSFASAILG